MLDTIRIGDINVVRAPTRDAPAGCVLFVHGYFADATVWTRWLERFAAHGIAAYAIHLRGRGGSGSEDPLGRVSIEDFADDASAVARHLGARAIVGHSMGGLIAQKLAERGDADAAVLVTPAPPRGISVLSPALAVRQFRYLPAILGSRVVTPRREDLRTLVLNRVPHEDQEVLLDLMVPDSGRAGRDMSITGVRVDATRVRCPMLAIAADDDRFIPASIVERIARRYGAPLIRVPGHGHMVIVEPGWETLADRVEDWLRRQI